MKVRFVIPWYGIDIPGGAEFACRKTAENLHAKGIEVEILTTCAKDCYNWSNFHRPGTSKESDITVKRFIINARDGQAFDSINFKLMHNLPISIEEENVFIKEMINSQTLYEYIKRHKDGYYFFIPYMFSTTYYGCQIHPDISFLIPCMHDESYAYLNIYKKPFSRVKGIISLSHAEQKLTQKIFKLSQKKTHLLGVGVDQVPITNPNVFKQKYNIKNPFILYVGRKEIGKNVKLLIDYFIDYKKLFNNNLKLVLMGGGSIEIPEEGKADIVDIGFVSQQDKNNAFAAALCHCQPSNNESFSFTIMESWLNKRPVLVNKDCDVTTDHCLKSNGGLYFFDAPSFFECINYLQHNPERATEMAKNGLKYVRNNYNWDILVEKYRKLLSYEN